MGYTPTIETWDGVPPPIQTWDGVPPYPDLGQGTPHHPDLGWGTPPLPKPGTGYPPPPMVNRQTFPSINITFPRTTYAGGKYTQNIIHVLIFHQCIQEIMPGEAEQFLFNILINI